MKFLVKPIGDQEPKVFNYASQRTVNYVEDRSTFTFTIQPFTNNGGTAEVVVTSVFRMNIIRGLVEPILFRMGWKISGYYDDDDYYVRSNASDSESESAVSTSTSSSESESSEEPEPVAPPAKRGRGRPPKVARRGVGRPRKIQN